MSSVWRVVLLMITPAKYVRFSQFSSPHHAMLCVGTYRGVAYLHVVGGAYFPACASPSVRLAVLLRMM